jgi:hypothetical protein
MLISKSPESPKITILITSHKSIFMPFAAYVVTKVTIIEYPSVMENLSLSNKIFAHMKCLPYNITFVTFRSASPLEPKVLMVIRKVSGSDKGVGTFHRQSISERRTST